MHSTADIARKLGVTVQAVNKYRRKLEKRNGKQFGTADPKDGRRTLFTDDEFQQIKELAPALPREAVDAEIVDGEDVEVVSGPTSVLGLRHSSLPAMQRQRFDMVAAQSDIAGIQHQTATIANRGDNIFSEFARLRMAQALTNVERTIATLEANALGDAVEMLGKPVGGENG